MSAPQLANNMNLKYREGNIEDIQQLKDLALSSYGQFEKVMTLDNWDTLHEKLKSESSYTTLLEIAKCFVCECEGKIIGVAYIVPSGHPTEIFESNWSYIRMVGVDPEFRGNGISKKLTQQCIEYATINGETIIALHTSEIMDSARYIYETLGFKKIKELNPLFGKKYWLYHLVLN